jgi:hypothetical protein
MPDVPPVHLTRDYSQMALGPMEPSLIDALFGLPQVVDARKRGEPLRDPATIAKVGGALDYSRILSNTPLRAPISQARRWTPRPEPPSG